MTVFAWSAVYSNRIVKYNVLLFSIEHFYCFYNIAIVKLFFITKIINYLLERLILIQIINKQNLQCNIK